MHALQLQKKTSPVWKREPDVSRPCFLSCNPAGRWTKDYKCLCLHFQLHLSCHSPLSQQFSLFFFLTCLLAAARAIQQFPSPIFTRVQILLSSHGSCFSLACSLISCHHSLLCPTTGSCCTGGDEQKHGEGKADTKGCAFKGAANNFEFLGINRSILLWIKWFDGFPNRCCSQLTSSFTYITDQN